MGNMIIWLENWKLGNFEYGNDRVKEKYVKCIECVRLILVFLFNELKFGYYIVFRNVYYDYYGIVYLVDNVKKIFIIIEVLNIFVGVFFGIVSLWFLLVVKSKVNIIVSRKILDFKIEKIVFVCYWKRFSRKKIVKCVVYYVSIIFFCYNLFSNNCEYFVIYCVIGYKLSF